MKNRCDSKSDFRTIFTQQRKKKYTKKISRYDIKRFAISVVSFCNGLNMYDEILLFSEKK